MTGRDELIAGFVAGAGWEGARLEPLAGDASQRRYLRLARGEQTAVLMDAPPERGEDVRPFVAMTEWLVDHGFSAPRLLASDPAAGLLLLEDLGDNLYARHLVRRPEAETPLYEAAVRLLVHLADLPAPATIGSGACAMALPPYDAAALGREAALIADWWVPAATGTALDPEERADFLDRVAAATAAVAAAREVVVLRDYHAENLLWLPGRRGHARIGLLDYQDALAGHPAYDLMSVLEDARRDTSEALQQAMIGLYLAERPALDPADFRAAYAALGAQRNLKIVGIFTRLAVRDGKRQYLPLIPRVWGHLRRGLGHPALAPVADWVTRHVPEPTAEALARAAGRAAVS